MLIIGCDFHTRYQQIAMDREETGELLVERRLDHESGEAHAFPGGCRTPVVLKGTDFAFPTCRRAIQPS